LRTILNNTFLQMFYLYHNPVFIIVFGSVLILCQFHFFRIWFILNYLWDSLPYSLKLYQSMLTMRGVDGKQCSVFVYREILILNTLIGRLLIIIFPLSKLVYIRFNSKWLNRLQAILNECSYRNEILVKILESADPTPLY
jgi:hypothetical protein